MFSILGKGTRLCDRITRREMIRIGGLSTLGLSLPMLLARSSASAAPNGLPAFGKAKSIIYVWLQGGPPQHETFDPKPEAPVEIRGPFRPIHTNVPGIDFCELLPRTARLADKLAVVRSLATDENSHEPSGYEVLTGVKYQGPNPRVISPTDWPYFGSLVKMLRPSEKAPPLSSVWIPEIMRLNENVTPAGQTGGFLGRQWDPDRFTGDPALPGYQVEGFQTGNMQPLRLERRKSLLAQVESHFRNLERGTSIGVYDQFQQQAFDLLTSGTVRNAFAIEREPEEIRNRYGRHSWGQCLLLARRLVEAGVRLVHVNWCREPGDSAVDNPMWDTHAQNADRVEDVLCPMFDVGFTALMEDLEQRGLLEETLVVAIGEFGRTPKINSAGGRDHWGMVFSFLLAGAGITTAQVYGASDKTGGYPARDRLSTADLTATLFHLIGIAPSGKFHDPLGRELSLTTGQPIAALLGGGRATNNFVPATGDLNRVPPFDGKLLLNVDFADDVPLYRTDLGSRPKGWRGTPLIDDAAAPGFGVRRIAGEGALPIENAAGRPHVLIGGFAGEAALSVDGGSQAILAQEMRNPRAGTFRMRVQAAGVASSREAFDRFVDRCTFRLVMYRYADMGKDPTRRHELGSVVFQPQSSEGEAERFELVRKLDSTRPNENFSIGAGLGVAIVCETAPGGPLELGVGQYAFLRVDRVELDFFSRTIDENVTV